MSDKFVPDIRKHTLKIPVWHVMTGIFKFLRDKISDAHIQI
ncbi:Uncharacterized protein dnm_001320 [Desulfonema magnum]|uniref:Uncharacterized protein n=1 Tax=Desulfonema magnum TaxID=45655 RepID=A0A975BEC1_9BACT|nr:Uncharacterized protein dnm_001320 [Desulfonema magnum]